MSLKVVCFFDHVPLMPKFTSEMIYCQVSCKIADADCIDDETLKGLDVAMSRCRYK